MCVLCGICTEEDFVFPFAFSADNEPGLFLFCLNLLSPMNDLSVLQWIFLLLHSQMLFEAVYETVFIEKRITASNYSASSSSTTTVPAPPTKPSPHPGLKRLTQEYMNEWLLKGLCFHCDEKFAPGHQCKTKHQFFYIEGRTNEELKQ